MNMEKKISREDAKTRIRNVLSQEDISHQTCERSEQTVYLNFFANFAASRGK